MEHRGRDRGLRRWRAVHLARSHHEVTYDLLRVGVDDYLDLAGAVLTEPLMPNQGKVAPRGLGLRLEWDEKAVDKYALV